MINLNSKYPMILNKNAKHKFIDSTKIIEQFLQKRKKINIK